MSLTDIEKQRDEVLKRMMNTKPEPAKELAKRKSLESYKKARNKNLKIVKYLNIKDKK